MTPETFLAAKALAFCVVNSWLIAAYLTRPPVNRKRLRFTFLGTRFSL